VRVQLQPAYLLHRRPYRDNSDLLDVFTAEYGLLGIVARGMGRKRRGGTLAAVLQPFRPILLSFSGRGDLQTLTGAELATAAQALHGEALLSALYLNELLQRLLQRGEAQAQLFVAYGAVLENLVQASGRQALQRCLREFEFTLLELLGYAVDLRHDAEQGRPFDNDSVYQLIPEHGFVPLHGVADGAPGYRGADLIAIGEGRVEDASVAAKQIVRQLLQPHLGARPVRSRGMFIADSKASEQTAPTNFGAREY